MRSGVIIAGGRSTRFEGGDKAVADLAGEPMVRRVADRVAAVVDKLVLNCRTDQEPALREAVEGVGVPVSVAVDPEPDRGPTAGLAAGLGAADAEYAAVVACDMPFVDPAFLAWLFERADDHDAAVPRPDDWYQTTQAVYRTGSVAAACERVLADDDADSRILTALSDLDVAAVDREAVEAHGSMETFENVNTHEDLQAASEQF
ncbi:molybdenum cofactor guanylyltransferase [Halobacterium rubrum]|uniref:molybdenum cofactor guanylyltransferase n=1 Tax=Halobacterium TaxID=2239 RepID=UPI001F20C272|nr:molybdenum cofactor guanylyltransferase [Halobacterium rubrum]MDH5020432.1 molybdenum cofactor guanylyltransferase [Halobacterium rubrum]